jgi:trk/ktr system potassium uptake protein
VQIHRYVSPVDPRSLAAEFRRPAKLLALALAVPFLVSLWFREWQQAVLFGALATVSFGYGKRRQTASVAPLSQKDALIFAALAYLAFALVGAIVYLPEMSFVDSFFESMSGFTTTGLSLLDVEAAPRSLLFFRAYSQWIGGAGIVVLSIVFLPGGRATLLPLYAAEFREENLLGNIVSTTRLVFSIYGGLTFLGFVAFVACGMGAYDALLHVLSTLSTGGFSPYADSIGHFRSPAVEIAVMVFMLVGAVAFPLYYRAAREGAGKLFFDSQLRALVIFSGLGVGLALVYTGFRDEPRLLLTNAFHAVSAITTTGFNVTDTRGWPEGVKLLAILLMTIGGSAGSTAGGLKLVRVLVLLRVAEWTLRRAFLPSEAELPIRQGGRVLRDEDIKSVVGLAVLYLGFNFLCSVLLTFTGASPLDALFESTSALGTVGLSTGLTAPGLPAWAKLVLALEMWAGRLEILPLLVLFYPVRRSRLGRSS